MTTKEKYRGSKKARKLTRKLTRKYTKRRTCRRRRGCIRGGNYEKDITVQNYQGFPMKQSNKVVTTVPGRGVMSVSAYKNLMESEERNGFDFYD